MLNLKSMKNTLTSEQIVEALTRLGSKPPIYMNGALVFDTVCHNFAHCGSKKLYYYLDSKMFRCYTGCGDFFDIFELIKRAFEVRDINMGTTESMYWLYKNTKTFFTEDSEYQITQTNAEIIEKELVFYDEKDLDILKFRPNKSWIDHGIEVESMLKYNIKYNPVSCCTIIPHYDIENRLIGIRQRTLVVDEENYGKYRPAFINGKAYPHPLSYNLYGLNYNKHNIIEKKKAIVFEGEKSVLIMDKYSDSCAVACCGSSLSAYQVKLLLDLGVEEIIIAFDKEFLEIDDEMFMKNTKNLQNISKRFSSKVLISFIFDKWNKLKLKDSPIERGLDAFNFLLYNRFSLEQEKSSEI